MEGKPDWLSGFPVQIYCNRRYKEEPNPEAMKNISILVYLILKEKSTICILLYINTNSCYSFRYGV